MKSNHGVVGSVSIIVPTYNCGKWIEQTIDSVLAQTYESYELIIIDDGSTDDTADKINKYYYNKKIIYKKQNNTGQASARNHGLRLATGEYVAYLDADDTWEPSKLEKQVECLKNKRDHLCYTGGNSIGPDGELLESIDPMLKKFYCGNVTKQLFRANFVPFSTVMVAKKYVELAGGSREHIKRSDDWDLLLRISLLCKFCFIPENLMNYRLHRPGRLSIDIDGRFNSANNIAKEFLLKNPHILTKRDVRQATAYRYRDHAYKYRAYGTSLCKNYFLTSLYYYFFSLMHEPFSLETYKGIIGLLIGKKNTDILR